MGRQSWPKTQPKEPRAEACEANADRQPNGRRCPLKINDCLQIKPKPDTAAISLNKIPSHARSWPLTPHAHGSWQGGCLYKQAGLPWCFHSTLVGGHSLASARHLSKTCLLRHGTSPRDYLITVKGDILGITSHTACLVATMRQAVWDVIPRNPPDSDQVVMGT